MIKELWMVSKDDERPAGAKGVCFYCRALIGEEHKKECVSREKTVMIELKIPVVIKVPESWNEEDIEFSINESSSCFDNLIEQITETSDRIGCLCGIGKGKYLRDATDDDESKYMMFIDKEKNNQSE